MGTGIAESSERPRPGAVSTFLLDFADALMAAGTQTSRVVRNVERLAGNFGCRAEIIILPKHCHDAVS